MPDEGQIDSEFQTIPYLVDWLFTIIAVVKTTRRKTSFEVDFDKVDHAKKLLGTTTLTDTIDAALDEVIALERRRQLVDLLFADDELDLGDPEVMSGAWR